MRFLVFLLLAGCSMQGYYPPPPAPTPPVIPTPPIQPDPPTDEGVDFPGLVAGMTEDAVLTKLLHLGPPDDVAQEPGPTYYRRWTVVTDGVGQRLYTEFKDGRLIATRVNEIRK